jgi:hypothetical protein
VCDGVLLSDEVCLVYCFVDNYVEHDNADDSFDAYREERAGE